jgi:CubicO group peptidase (beta-lactamase class C family)
MIAIAATWAIAAALVVSACSDSGSSVTTEELQPIVDEWAERHTVSDLAVSVRSPSGSFTSVGYSTGDEVPNSSSLWMTGSITKTITAATVLLLVEDGTLDLDEPIVRWLPEFPRAGEITLRMLLSHTAGIAAFSPAVPDEFTFAELAVFLEPVTVADNLAIAKDSIGDMSLPAAYQYSNPGYWVVGAVIEAATGEPVADVIRAQIFEPLGMDGTYAAWSEPVEGDVVPGELELPDGMRVPVESEFVPSMASRGWVAGGGVSCARDMAAFFGALFDDLLAPESVEIMKTGLGIVPISFAGGQDGWHHGGEVLGYVSMAGVNADGWAVAVYTNRDKVVGAGPDPTELLSEVMAYIGTEA